MQEGGRAGRPRLAAWLPGSAATPATLWLSISQARPQGPALSKCGAVEGRGALEREGRPALQQSTTQPTVRGQVNHLNCEKIQANSQEAATVPARRGGGGRRARGAGHELTRQLQPSACIHQRSSFWALLSYHCAPARAARPANLPGHKFHLHGPCAGPITPPPHIPLPARSPQNPPMNPSHVFLGDSLISGVRPKKKPAQGGGRGRGGGQEQEATFGPATEQLAVSGLRAAAAAGAAPAVPSCSRLPLNTTPPLEPAPARAPHAIPCRSLAR